MTGSDPRSVDCSHSPRRSALRAAQQLDRRGSDHHERVSRKPDLRRRDQRVQRDVDGRRGPAGEPRIVGQAARRQIEKRIHSDATLKRYNIDVYVDGGVATLTGTVPTEADRAKAATLANVKGIARVDNKIVVDLPGATKGTAGTIKEKTKEGAEKTKEGAEKVG